MLYDSKLEHALSASNKELFAEQVLAVFSCAYSASKSSSVSEISMSFQHQHLRLAMQTLDRSSTYLAEPAEPVWHVFWMNGFLGQNNIVCTDSALVGAGADVGEDQIGSAGALPPPEGPPPGFAEAGKLPMYLVACHNVWICIGACLDIWKSLFKQVNYLCHLCHSSRTYC